MSATNLAPLGTLSSTHKVYEDPFRLNKWTTAPPEQASPPVEDAESAQHALVVRYKLSDNPARELDLHSIVVQSPYLKSILGYVLGNYPGITLELERLEFNAPFECFIHRWEKLLEKRRSLEDESLYQSTVEEEERNNRELAHLDLLYSTLTTELGSTLRTKQDLLKNGVITPLHVGMIFEPGCLIYTKTDGHDRVYKLQSAKWEVQNKRRIYKLECEFVDHDGVSFGMNKESLIVSAWTGTKKITKLEAYPLIFHQEGRDLESRLIGRGEQFEAYQGFHFAHYKGIAYGKVSRGEAKFNVDSRICLDSAASNRYNTKVNLEYFETEEVFADATSVVDTDEVMDNDCVVLAANEKKASPSTGPPVQTNTKSVLTHEQLLLADARVRGYSLRDKKWMTFYIDNIQDITWNEDAFDSLVAPQEQKDLILAFGEAQTKNRISFDDFIQGKGKGIIMLLSGPPGVGKTLTAESVAETMRVPLYSIGAAELGSKPNHLEKKLEDILVMCAKWNAVLLLDEADVFMEARGTHDLDHSRMVSIFLRLLEYFEGIMFLTTNRLEQMDTAFESRIHLTLNYTELDKASRRQVWSKFLNRNVENVAISHFSDADLDKLAKVQLNGRQIKNTLKTAQLLAARQDESLSMAHLDVVLKLRRANEKKVGFFGGE